MRRHRTEARASAPSPSSAIKDVATRPRRVPLEARPLSIRHASVLDPKTVARLERALQKAATIHRQCAALLERLDDLRNRLAQQQQVVVADCYTLTKALRDLRPATPAPPERARRLTPPAPAFTPCEQVLLQVLAQRPNGCTWGQLTVLAGSPDTEALRKVVDHLRTLTYLRGPTTGILFLTRAGRAAIPGATAPLPTGTRLREHWLTHPDLSRTARGILAVLIEAYAGGFTADQLTQATGMRWSRSFRNALGTLRRAGLLIGRNTEVMRASAALFTE